MSKSKIKIVVIIILALMVVNNVFINSRPIPTIPTIPNVVIDNDNKPEPSPVVNTKRIFFDDYISAIKISKQNNKKLIIIFGADWCPYCEELKKDIQNIKQLEKLIICIIDTDNRQANQNTINKYRPKNLPTSILIDKEKEISRKIGYRKKDYLLWLNAFM